MYYPGKQKNVPSKIIHLERDEHLPAVPPFLQQIYARNAHSAACFIVGGNGATGLYWSHSELVFTGLI
jgi:hypothetical protein